MKDTDETGKPMTYWGGLNRDASDRKAEVGSATIAPDAPETIPLGTPAWIEQALLPELQKYRSTKYKQSWRDLAWNLKQFILSRKDEWRGK